MKKLMLFGALVAFGGLLGLAADPAPDFSLGDLAGKTVKLSALKGKVVLLNFWATWCPPCRAEMPSLEKLYGSLKGDRRFVMLAVDIQEPLAKVKSFVTDQGFNFRVLLDTQGQAAGLYSISAIPTTFLIGPDGTIVDKAVGGTDWADPAVLKKIQSLLKGSNP